jgi:hypothetical protein
LYSPPPPELSNILNRILFFPDKYLILLTLEATIISALSFGIGIVLSIAEKKRGICDCAVEKTAKACGSAGALPLFRINRGLYAPYGVYIRNLNAIKTQNNSEDRRASVFGGEKQFLCLGKIKRNAWKFGGYKQ